MAMILEELATADVSIVADHEITSTSGVGAISTGTPLAPRTYRSTRDGVITTQIKFDLTGLTCYGHAADDVVGLAAATDAYIGRYVVADCGVVFKTALSCIETPAEGTVTISTNINITSNSASDLGCNEAAGAAQPITGADVAIGATIENHLNTMAAGDYLYITEENSDATTGIYNAGQFIFTMWGHAALA